MMGEVMGVASFLRGWICSIGVVEWNHFGSFIATTVEPSIGHTWIIKTGGLSKLVMDNGTVEHLDYQN